MKIFSRLKKVNNSFALGDLIPISDQVVNLINGQYPQLSDSNLIKDQGKEAMWGGISDDGTAIVELYCFRLDNNDIIGIAVGQKIKITDFNKNQYDKVGNYQITPLNIFRENGKISSDGETPLELRNKIINNGLIIGGSNETFTKGYSSIQQVFNLSKEKSEEQIL